MYQIFIFLRAYYHNITAHQHKHSPTIKLRRNVHKRKNNTIIREENKGGRSLTKIIKTSSRGRKKPKAFSET